MISQAYNEHYFWHLVSYFGSSQLLLPAMAIALTKLWYTNQEKSAYKWIIALVIAILITALSKILFLAWGIGIESLDFIGISGHTLLASSIIPLSLYTLTGMIQSKMSNIGLWLGVLLSFLVGFSRLELNAHSMSEVIAGWILGFIVSNLVLKCMINNPTNTYKPKTKALLILLITCSATLINIPTPSKMAKLATKISGQDEPHTRLHKLSDKLEIIIKISK